jgi:hypothetical protein
MLDQAILGREQLRDSFSRFWIRTVTDGYDLKSVSWQRLLVGPGSHSFLRIATAIDKREDDGNLGTGAWFGHGFPLPWVGRRNRGEMKGQAV